MTNGIPSETNGIPSETTLLPCPFCGDEARGIADGYVFCDCGASAPIEAWNSRSVTAAAVMGYEAAQAERTCTNTSYRLDESRFHCSECGFGCWVKDVADGHDKLPNYCPNCGAKVSGD